MHGSFRARRARSTRLPASVNKPHARNGAKNGAPQRHLQVSPLLRPPARIPPRAAGAAATASVTPRPRPDEANIRMQNDLANQNARVITHCFLGLGVDLFFVFVLDV